LTTEDDFQRALDENPNDWDTRLVFADFLQDRDDPRAEGYRALGTIRTYPSSYQCGWNHATRGYTRTKWRWEGIYTGRPYPGCLKMIWYNLLDQPTEVIIDDVPRKYGWDSRREAEDAAALAFLLIPIDQRHRAYK
jgi:uncharacterized protein (TIGR02996 family)